MLVVPPTKTKEKNGCEFVNEIKVTLLVRWSYNYMALFSSTQFQKNTFKNKLYLVTSSNVCCRSGGISMSTLLQTSAKMVSQRETSFVLEGLLEMPMTKNKLKCNFERVGVFEETINNKRHKRQFDIQTGMS